MKKQLVLSTSFGTQSVSIAEVGRNGGLHWPETIAYVNRYSENDYKMVDHRDKEEKRFTSQKEMMQYLQLKYYLEIGVWT